METRLFQYLKKHHGWTSKKAPEKWLIILGWSQKKFYRILMGKQLPSVVEAGVLAAILQCDISDIFDLEVKLETNTHV